MSLDKALDELMDGDIIVFQKYVSLECPPHSWTLATLGQLWYWGM